MSKNRNKKQSQKRKKRRAERRLLLAFVAIAVLGLLALFLYRLLDGERRTSTPQFQKDGELQFVDQSGDTLATIDIEIADDDLERSRGLMWRDRMAPNQGMLFIMEQPEPQTFWMLNTYLALDIIFADTNRNIVTIRPNTQPRSLDPISSDQPALYVIEVVAGFCQEHQVSVGDRFEFSRLQ